MVAKRCRCWRRRVRSGGWVSAFVTLGYLYCIHGDFALALDAATQITTIGEAIDDRRLPTNAAFLQGLVYAARGEWDAGIAAYQHARDHAPDMFETALIVGPLGDAYREKGDVAEAISLLEYAVQQRNQYRSRQVQSWFSPSLGKPMVHKGASREARDWICQGLTLATTIAFPWGIGLAQRALGRLALSYGAFAEADQSLHDALHTLSSIQYRVEIGRTHLDLASTRPQPRQRGHRHNASEHSPCLVSETPGAQVGREDGATGS